MWNRKYVFLLLLMFGLFFVAGLNLMGSDNVMSYNSFEGLTGSTGCTDTNPNWNPDTKTCQ